MFNQNVKFRRVNGRVVPIRAKINTDSRPPLTQGQKGSLQIAGGVGVGASSGAVARAVDQRVKKWAFDSNLWKAKAETVIKPKGKRYNLKRSSTKFQSKQLKDATLKQFKDKALMSQKLAKTGRFGIKVVKFGGLLASNRAIAHGVSNVYQAVTGHEPTEREHEITEVAAAGSTLAFSLGYNKSGTGALIGKYARKAFKYAKNLI